jgi:Holliday junction resolvase RusA-like endonuclease
VLPRPDRFMVEFVLQAPPASSKNRRRIFARGNRVVSLPSKDAEASAKAIRAAAKAAIGDEPMPFGAEDALRIDLEHDVATDRVLVRVLRIGSIPTRGKKGTKRDVHGMIETVADALQGVLFPDDRQVDVAHQERRRG